MRGSSRRAAAAVGAPCDDSRPDLRIDPDAIALLNYTSGSTGQPKGVVQTHRSALAHAVRYANAYRLSDADRMLKTAGSMGRRNTY